MDMSKDNNRRKEDGKDKKRAKRRGRVAVTVIALAVMCWGVWQFTSMASRYDGDEAVWIRIPWPIPSGKHSEMNMVVKSPVTGGATLPRAGVRILWSQERKP